MGQGEYSSINETICTVADKGVLGHRGRAGVCMCTGWHACAVHIYYLSSAYIVDSCDVRPLLQEQGTDVVMAITGCTVQCSIATLQ